VTFEVEASQALQFSPNGSYMIARGRHTCVNAMAPEPRQRPEQTLLTFDLLAGKMTLIKFLCPMPLSFDIDDFHLKVLRLSDDNAIELNTYKLPELIGMERFHLTYLPQNSCCPTCKQPLRLKSWVTLLGDGAESTIAVGHSRINLGLARLSDSICEPLILRTSKPRRSIAIPPLDSIVVVQRFSTSFPSLINLEGKVSTESFDQKNEGADFGDEVEDIPLEANENLANPLPSITRQMLPQFDNFWAQSGKETVLPENIENRIRLRVLRATNLLSNGDMITPEFKQSIIDILKNVHGDDFPFDEYDDFMRSVRELRDPELTIGRVMAEYSGGANGFGCKIPLFVQTFNFNDVRGTAKFSWSSSADVGWIEEELDWFYDQLLDLRSGSGRQWYPFDRLIVVESRMRFLYTSNSEQGERFRRFWSPAIEWADGKKAIEQPEARKAIDQKSSGNAESSKKKVDQSKAEALKNVDFYEKMSKEGPDGIMDKWKDVRKSLSDIAPGLGQFLDYRMQMRLAQSFENPEW
jgi:hypothetical protein